MTDPNEPAFPQTINDMGTFRSMTEGLSKRELLAAMAMQSILANPRIVEEWKEISELADCIAEKAKEAADALIAELSKPPQP